MARPSEFNNDVADKIIDRINNGESCASVMRDPAMPAQSTLYYWLARNREFSERYALALEYRTHQLAETRHDIINDAFTNGVPDNFEACPSVWGNLVKEQLRAIEWDAERLAAKKYKPRQEVEHTVNTGDVSDALANLKE